jgi:ATP-dependent DNA helicase PIF1
VAALNIGGSTVHSWAGIGLADDEGMELLNKVANNKKATNRIKNSKLLIIDEISMASAPLLDKIDIVCQFIRNCDAPFGGLQVVLVGDFMQLPPVFNKMEEEKFAFESDAWKHAKVTTVNLLEIIRQHDDPTFAKFLNEVRFGSMSNFDILEPCFNRQFPDDGIFPVRLFCKNYNVDQYNHDKLAELKSPEKTYYSVDDAPEQWVKFLDKNCRAPNPLTLKVGAQVMLLVNLDTAGGLVNGSVGVVEKLYDTSVVVRFANGTFPIEPFEWEIKQNEINVLGEMKKVRVAARKQIPLRLAYALSIHKAQGATLDRAEVDASEAFACGQTYVALSRVRNLESLRLKKFSPSKVTVNKKCLDFYKKSEEDRKQLEQFFEP